MAKFRKKPVEIEAIRFDVGNGADILEWANRRSTKKIEFRRETSGDYCLRIPTLEGIMYADTGDWIICGVNGELYPCKPDIFSETYDAVE